jgi:hypothetical protein
MNMLREIVAAVKCYPVITIAVIIVGLALGAVTGVIVRLALAYYFGS